MSSKLIPFFVHFYLLTNLKKYGKIGGARTNVARQNYHYTTSHAILSRLFAKIFIFLFFPKGLTNAFLCIILSIESEGKIMKTVNEVIRLMNQTFTNRVIECEKLEEFASDLGLYFSYGETRFCIFDPSWDVVLKIPRFENVHDDYSAIEVKNYKNACELGLERIFLECGLLTNLDCECPIYWQVKFSYSHAHLPNSKRKREREKIEKHCHCPIYLKVKYQMPNDRTYRNEWLCRAYQLYGKQFFKQLCVFLKENKIGDLHQENVGWKGNKPIILDFAGYHG